MKKLRLAVVSFALFAAALARAAEAPSSEIRYATLVACTLDGDPSSDSAAKLAFEKGMGRSGARFVDVAQSRISHAASDLSELVRSDAIRAADADVIVAIDARAFKDAAGDALSASGTVRYLATADATLIAVDTAERLDGFSVERAAVAATAEAARRTALQRVGDALAEAILDNKKRPSERVELWVQAFPITASDQLRGALRQISGVRSAKVVYASPALTKIALLLDASAPRGQELTDAIHRAPDTGISVTRVSDRVLHAEYVARLKILFTHFLGNQPRIGRRLPSLIGNALREGDFLVRAAPAPVELGRVPGERERKLEKLGLLDTNALFLSGEYFVGSADQIDIEAEIWSARGLELLVRDRDTCTEPALNGCSSGLAKRLLEKLPKALARRRSSGTVEAPALVISRLTLEERIFPARASAYEERGMGRVAVENRSRSKAIGGGIRVRISDLDPVFAEVPDVPPGGKVEFSVPLSLSRTPEPSNGAPVRIEVGYDVAGRRETVERTSVVRILPLSALEWSEPESIAAFIADQTDDARMLSTAALAKIPAERRSDPVARAAALFHALIGLRYQNDPRFPGPGSNEIDEIQLPIETLARGTGDCDDLSVLYAALGLASGGGGVLFVLAPGHIFPAVEAGLAQSAKRVHLDADHVIVHEGKSYIPVETTRLSGSFQDAWDAAAAKIAEVKRDRGALELVELQKAWEKYPALTFAPAKKTSNHGPSFAGLKAELEAIDRARAIAIEKALGEKSDLGSLDARALSDRAALLVGLGRAEEAVGVLEGAAARFPRIPELSNNLANAHLALDRADTALGLYKKSLARIKTRERSTRVRLNAALAAHVKGGAALFHEYLREAIEHATTDASRAVIEEFLMGLDGAGRLTGTDRTEKRTLAARARDVLRSEEQRERARASVADIVYWLEPEDGK